MKKLINPQKNEFQWVIGIGDYHDKDHPANKEQRADLEAILKKCLNERVKLIVEDLSSINNDGYGMCCNYIINSRGGVLGKLADFARSNLIDVDNVEYRFCRVVGIGPLLNNNGSKDVASGRSLTIDALYKEVINELEKVAKYDDGARINALYKRTIGNVTKDFDQLRLDRVRNLSIGEYCARFCKNNYTKKLEWLCIFDSPLIDLKILHSVLSSQNKSVVIVAAGGSHIEKMNSFLESAGGYEKVTIPFSTAHMYQGIQNNMFVSGKRKNNNNQKNNLPAINFDVLEQFLFDNELIKKKESAHD